LLESLLSNFQANFQVVSDPWFYAVAIPAVLLIGLSKSGFASGFGSLATPLVALTVPVPQAAAILLPLLIVMDFTGLQQLWRERDSGLLRSLVPWGILGTLIGAALFGVLSTAAVSGLVGALTLGFLAQRLLFPPRADSQAMPRWVGSICAAISGLASFVAHAGSPPVAAYLLPMRMKPLRYSGTLAVYFTALNLFKLLPYAALAMIDFRNLATSLVLLPFTPLGVWAGVKLTKRVSPALFYKLAYAGMFLTGAKLLWDGFK
jgi:uncharacterized membrane protein YfcA